MPLDEDCCKDDADPSGYSGRFVNVVKKLGSAKERKKEKFDLDDLEL